MHIPIKTATDSDFKTTRYSNRKTATNSDINSARFWAPGFGQFQTRCKSNNQTLEWPLPVK